MLRRDDGQVVVEYALVAVLVSVVAVVVISAIGGSVSALLSPLLDAF